MVKYCLIFCFLLQGILVSKADTLQVFGTIHDTDNPFVHVNYYVVNKRVGKGIFGNSQGKFSMLCKYSDTIAISADGYYTIRLTLRDSVRKGEKNLRLRVGLRKKEVVLQTVSIVPQRDIQRIKEELDRIKDPSEIKLVNVSALESPLTALYQAFSKIERSKYKVAVMEAEDRKCRSG